MTIVGYVQFEPQYGRVDENISAMRRLIASSDRADLLVLPELAASGYDFVDTADAKSMAEPMGEGPLAAMLHAMAAERRVTLICGYAERAGDSLYNACIMVTPDGAFHNYRKLHLFSREKLFFTPGDAPPPVIETPAGRVGMMICFDWFFPETARLLALNGAQLIAHPSNLVLPWCQRAMFARSVENRIFSITANRTGTETQAGRTLTFTGSSQILDWKGETLAAAPATGEHIGLADIQLSEADSKAINPFNDLFGDRRIEFYGPLINR